MSFIPARRHDLVLLARRLVLGIVTLVFSLPVGGEILVRRAQPEKGADHAVLVDETLWYVSDGCLFKLGSENGPVPLGTGCDPSLKLYVFDGELWASAGTSVYRGIRSDHVLTVRNTITDLVLRDSKNLWIGTSAGLVHGRLGDPVRSRTYLKGKAIGAVEAGASGNLWLSTRTHSYRLCWPSAPCDEPITDGDVAWQLMSDVERNTEIVGLEEHGSFLWIHRKAAPGSGLLSPVKPLVRSAENGTEMEFLGEEAITGVVALGTEAGNDARLIGAGAHDLVELALVSGNLEAKPLTVEGGKRTYGGLHSIRAVAWQKTKRLLWVLDGSGVHRFDHDLSWMASHPLYEDQASPDLDRILMGSTGAWVTGKDGLFQIVHDSKLTTALDCRWVPFNLLRFCTEEKLRVSTVSYQPKLPSGLKPTGVEFTLLRGGTAEAVENGLGSGLNWKKRADFQPEIGLFPRRLWLLAKDDVGNVSIENLGVVLSLTEAKIVATVAGVLIGIKLIRRFLLFLGALAVHLSCWLRNKTTSPIRPKLERLYIHALSGFLVSWFPSWGRPIRRRLLRPYCVARALAGEKVLQDAGWDYDRDEIWSCPESGLHTMKVSAVETERAKECCKNRTLQRTAQQCRRYLTDQHASVPVILHLDNLAKWGPEDSLVEPLRRASRLKLKIARVGLSDDLAAILLKQERVVFLIDVTHRLGEGPCTRLVEFVEAENGSALLAHTEEIADLDTLEVLPPWRCNVTGRPTGQPAIRR